MHTQVTEGHQTAVGIEPGPWGVLTCEMLVFIAAPRDHPMLPDSRAKNRTILPLSSVTVCHPPTSAHRRCHSGMSEWTSSGKEISRILQWIVAENLSRRHYRTEYCHQSPEKAETLKLPLAGLCGRCLAFWGRHGIITYKGVWQIVGHQ